MTATNAPDPRDGTGRENSGRPGDREAARPVADARDNWLSALLNPDLAWSEQEGEPDTEPGAAPVFDRDRNQAVAAAAATDPPSIGRYEVVRRWVKAASAASIWHTTPCSPGWWRSRCPSAGGDAVADFEALLNEARILARLVAPEHRAGARRGPHR